MHCCCCHTIARIQIFIAHTNARMHILCAGWHVWKVHFICLQHVHAHFYVVNEVVCVCVLMHFCACFKGLHIFPHCQHHSSGLLLFKRRGQRSLLFFWVPWPGSVLSCSVLNWTLTGCQQARGCMLPAFAFQEARVLVKGVSRSLKMLNTVLQNSNLQKKYIYVWQLASTSFCVEVVGTVALYMCCLPFVHCMLPDLPVAYISVCA